MKRVIYKYELFNGSWDIRVPYGSIVRHAGEQDGQVYVWIEHYRAERELPEDGYKTFRFLIVGTGHEFPDSHKLEFINTVQTDAGFVWHVFRDLR